MPRAKSKSSRRAAKARANSKSFKYRVCHMDASMRRGKFARELRDTHSAKRCAVGKMIRCNARGPKPYAHCAKRPLSKRGKQYVKAFSALKIRNALREYSQRRQSKKNKSRPKNKRPASPLASNRPKRQSQRPERYRDTPRKREGSPLASGRPKRDSQRPARYRD
jgi:hypothetical protein